MDSETRHAYISDVNAYLESAIELAQVLSEHAPSHDALEDAESVIIAIRAALDHLSNYDAETA